MKIKGTVSTSVNITGNISSYKTQTKKVVVPADYSQEVTPDAGFVGLKKVIVEAIPSTYGRISYNGSVIKVY